MAKSIASILFTTDSVELASKDATATTADSRGFITVGVDGNGDARFVLVDTTGRQVVVGAGVAGTPAGGVVSVQGVAGGTAVPVSGTFWQATQPISAASLPLPTGAATEATLATRLADATFTARIPVNGQALMAASIPVVLASDQSTVPISAASLPLPSGAATEATLATRLAETTFTARINTQGQKTMANSTPVVISSDQSAIPASQSGSWAVTAHQGNAGSHGQRWMVGLSDGAGFISPATDRTTAAAPFSFRLSDGSAFYDAAKTGQLPSALVGGRLDVNTGAWLGSTAPTVGQKTMANSIPIAIASDQSAVPVSQNGTWTVQQGTPPWQVVGPGAAGAAVTGNPVIAGGSDGTNARYISVDTSGRQVMVGAAADGASPAGNPVLTAGFDGTNVQTKLTDTSGRQRVVGAAADGAAVAGDPVLVAGQDGTNVQSLKTDTTGRQEVVGGAADGAAPAGNPVLIAGQDGTNVQSIKTDTDGRIEVAPTGATATTKGFADGNVVLSTTTVSPIRSTTYTEPSSGAQRSVASASAADTGAGTGARTVRIIYYTLSAGTIAGPFEETVTLDGTNPVNTVATNICYIEKLEVATVGSGGVNAGVITLYGSTAGGGGTVWTIAASTNKTFGAHHYVPSGKTANITGFLGGIKGADTSGFLLRAKNPADANDAEIQISDLLRAPSSGQSFRAYGTPIEVVGPARITAYAAPDSSSSRTYYASFDLYEQ